MLLVCERFDRKENSPIPLFQIGTFVRIQATGVQATVLRISIYSQHNDHEYEVGYWKDGSFVKVWLESDELGQWVDKDMNLFKRNGRATQTEAEQV